MAEFGLYIVIRQLVNGKEWLLACEYLLYEVAKRDNQTLFRARPQRGVAKEAQGCANLSRESLVEQNCLDVLIRFCG